MNAEIKTDTISSPPSNDGGGAVPSGFILKLFQMVNGAPDEVISWTPTGDAFIIGSDLNRLESETLPQYFRHNRFQSLVRQLNFYSFRKINRERNVWIYKHKLFHRDRPEDLHMVRRRTCPGIDGRKQRFSRFSAQKLSKYDDDDKSARSDDDSSIDASSVDESFELQRKKRPIVDEDLSPTSSKRIRGIWEAPPLKEDKVVVDTSILVEPTPSPTSVFDAHESLVDHKETVLEDDSSASKKSDRMDQVERAMIVSEVASKLEEHARRAMKGRGLARTRRGVPGVVTPPWGSSQNFTVTSQGLISYDDEFEDSGVVSDGEESLSGYGLTSSKTKSTPSKISKELLVPPVTDMLIVQQIIAEIRQRASQSFYNSEMIFACASLAEFLMSTAPCDTENCCDKVVGLLLSTDKLAADFHFYRAALRPDISCESGRNRRFDMRGSSEALRNALEGGDKHETLREFKIFAVNLIYKLLGKNGSLGVQGTFAQFHQDKLLSTAEAWSRSVATMA